MIPSLTLCSFLREVNDLTENGYYFLVDSEINGGRFMKLRHRSNGRTLILQYRHDEWQLREGKKVLKQVSSMTMVD